MSLLALLMGNSSPLEDQPSSTVSEPGVSEKLQKAFMAIDSFSRDKDYFRSLDDEQLKEAHLKVQETVSSLGSLGQWITKTLRKPNAKPSSEAIDLIAGSVEDPQQPTKKRKHVTQQLGESQKRKRSSKCTILENQKRCQNDSLDGGSYCARHQIALLENLPSKPQEKPGC